jgi:hypothetical protein
MTPTMAPTLKPNSTSTTTTSNLQSFIWGSRVDESAVYTQAADPSQEKLQGSMVLWLRGPDYADIAPSEKFRMAISSAVATAAFCHIDSPGPWPNCTTDQADDAGFLFTAPTWLNTSAFGQTQTNQFSPYSHPVVITGVNEAGDDRRLMGNHDGPGNIHVHFWLLAPTQQHAQDALTRLQEVASDVFTKFVQATDAVEERPDHHGLGVIPLRPDCGHCYVQVGPEGGVSSSPGLCQILECRDKGRVTESGAELCGQSGKIDIFNETKVDTDSFMYCANLKQDNWCAWHMGGSFDGRPCRAQASSRMAGWVMQSLADEGHEGVWLDVQLMEVEYFTFWQLGGSRKLLSAVVTATIALTAVANAALANMLVE